MGIAHYTVSRFYYAIIWRMTARDCRAALAMTEKEAPGRYPVIRAKDKTAWKEVKTICHSERYARMYEGV